MVNILFFGEISNMKLISVLGQKTVNLQANKNPL